ncbi:MAG: hypothetical protein PHO15_00420 [Eubacteriales bacterium]|nr:hypothetical protein [Eubacteriales bacterium]
MRKLKAKDICPFTKIVVKMDIKESLKAVFEKSSDDRNAIISEFIWSIIENYEKVEGDLFAFIADINETTQDKIQDMELDGFIKLITELFSEENIPFFKSAAR